MLRRCRRRRSYPAKSLRRSRNGFASARRILGIESGPTAKEQRLKQAKQHWAFQPPQLPSRKPGGQGFQLAPRSNDRQLCAGSYRSRRDEARCRCKPSRHWFGVSFLTLIGLPPSPHEIDALVADKSPEALENLVDRLLDSPQFGERWGRHWLDVVRFAESSGMEFNFTYPHAWPYRNYVIDSSQCRQTVRPFSSRTDRRRLIARARNRKHLRRPRLGGSRPACSRSVPNATTRRAQSFR